MRRIIAVAVIAAAAAAVMRYVAEYGQQVAASGNGHSGDQGRRDLLRARIAAARARLRDELDSVRGE
ncbi:MAG TPA: hypothetical protein VE777_18780 [Gaiellales bacterium]|jgi:hypothetical protein|nr:hypothetical protein [Gaiellales bacterium]